MGNSNFYFLAEEWPLLYQEAAEAERLTFNSPKACAIFCRSALEMAVNWLYANDADLELPYDTRLSALIHEKCFQDIIKPSHFREINLIRKFGNNAAHGKAIKAEESLVSLQNLYRFLAFIAIYYSEKELELNRFDESIIPTGNAIKEKEAELKRLEEELNQRQKQLKLAEEIQNAEAASNVTVQKALKEKEKAFQQRKKEREEKYQEKEVVPLLTSEKETRRLFIDQSLVESGWGNLKEGYNLEYRVEGMPISTNPTGIGYADYVLWGDNGLPLAVIEAKKTMNEASQGKHQAKLYADCLEKMHGQRPVIFYTNGFETFIWDDLFYVPRDISGFLTKEELQLAIYRRKDRKDLRNYKVKHEITDRPYQIEAIQRVAERFVGTDKDGKLHGLFRKALLVMATGSGKTRTAISIVDMLTKSNWAKRVLFLADRNALVTQAKNSFNDNLPNLSSIDLTKEKENTSTRLVFSTYPTIMNKIDVAKTDDERFFGPGHFDLIIIDEAHRSVYKKYGAIFNYFDALLVGLTATPKKELHHDTYELFDIEDDNPTFAYELVDAVDQGYLVPPKAYSVPIKFPREGIKYSDLSESEKTEYEEKFGDPTTGEAPEEIGSEALNRWLFNKDTVDKMLYYLMEHGLKVEGGDKLGKTIIFAKNHQHAIFIEKRFNKNYPNYKGDFLRVIDNYESKAQDLLERFCDDDKEQNPQIAVSVDMMDTGVDAPRVVNLVFFKLVRSYTKYWQMIGRGTRLRKDLFGPNEDKEYFLIFDLCGNIEFFEEFPQGAPSSYTISLTQKIIELKLELALKIRGNTDSSEEQDELSEKYINELHQLVKSFDRNRFMVKAAIRYVTKYSREEAWQNLSFSDEVEIKTYLANLVLPIKNDHELSRRFDVLMLILAIRVFEKNEASDYINKLCLIAKELKKKRNIPLIQLKVKQLDKVLSDSFWSGITVSKLEELRNELRELMRFLDKNKQEIVYTDFEDRIEEVLMKEKPILEYGKQAQPYRDRVETYLRKNKSHLVIHKIRNNEVITAAELEQLERLLFDGEERGSKEDFVKVFGEQPLGVFIRSILGLELEAANRAFSNFLQSGTLSANQITFVNQIISNLTKNGRIEAEMLFEPPFTDLSDSGLLGVFEDAEANKVINILKEIDERAVGM